MKFDAYGLLPAVVQHARSGEVLMLGYVNEEALRLTQERGLVTFWSRSRQELWQKGATSGNVLRVVELRQDCDGDALLILAEPAGPTCHTGERSCFHRDLEGNTSTDAAPPASVLTAIADTIEARRSAPPDESYTARLLAQGVDRIARKIGEEAGEVIIAAKNGDGRELRAEVADLIFHSLVLLAQQGLQPEDVWHELQQRRR
jgi:phosphoribosyl-AMP cyclohydrolase / phosphoribosyl-ATP pyrophosphohydrolase